MRSRTSKTRTTLVLVLSLVTVFPTLGFGSVIVGLNNPGSTTLHEIEVVPGETFGVDLNLESDRRLFSVQTAIEASAGGVFAVADATDNEPWNSTGTSLIVGPLDPQSGSFVTTLPYPAYFGPGQATLASLQIAVDSAANQGEYTLTTVNTLVMPERVNPWVIGGVPGDSVIIHIVPEPATWLLGLGAISLLVRRSR